MIVNEPSEDPVGEAIDTLRVCSGPNAPFVTKKVERGNYLVTYRAPAFSCMFFDEIVLNEDFIEDEFQQHLAEEELRAKPADWDPPFHAKRTLNNNIT